jgi:uncharacterized protein (TIGR01777 family)
MHAVFFDIIVFMKILICGGGGFIGQHLARFLLNQGLEVAILDRNKARMSLPGLKWFQADLLKPYTFDKDWFAGVDAVINLSGRDIFTRWNDVAKKAIWESRVTVNKNLVGFISSLDQKPKVFVSASAVGYYGDKGNAEVDESSPRGGGFLADVCGAWEKEAREAEKLGIRSVQVRTAPVLEKSGGILKQVLKSFKFGFAFTFGSGNTWFPWLHMEDLIRIYHFVVTNEHISGPVNAGSPHPVRFLDFINNLKQFKKALVLPFPVSILKLFLKETADVVLFSQKMVPTKLLENNFQFSFPKLRDALDDIFSR